MEIVTRVMVFSEEPMMAYGLRCLLEAQTLMRLAVSASSCDPLLETAKVFRPDILLLDLLPSVAPSLLSELSRAIPGSKLIVLASNLSPETSYQLTSHGVFGILRRNCTPGELLSVFNGAMSSATPLARAEMQPFEHGQAVDLSPREGQLVSLLAQGLKNKEIAHCLGIGEGTVKVYLSKLFQKTGVNDRFELALYGLRNSEHLLHGSRKEEKNEDVRPERNHVPALRSVWLRRHPPVAPGGPRRLATLASLAS